MRQVGDYMNNFMAMRWLTTAIIGIIALIIFILNDNLYGIVFFIGHLTSTYFTYRAYKGLK